MRPARGTNVKDVWAGRADFTFLALGGMFVKRPTLEATCFTFVA